jgi:tetratricopeptide (TPR) repeat protein
VNETLHEIPSNVEEMQKSLAYYASKCIEEENHITAGLLGNYYRMLKEYDKAEMWLDKAIELANKYDSDKSRIINLLRKATLYQWQHDFLRAYTLLNNVEIELKENEKFNILWDAFYQHKAKCLFEEKRYIEALLCFEKLLEIRQEKNDKKLVNTCIFYINITNVLLIKENF